LEGLNFLCKTFGTEELAVVLIDDGLQPWVYFYEMCACLL
jgi:hypothetical protein